MDTENEIVAEGDTAPAPMMLMEEEEEEEEQRGSLSVGEGGDQQQRGVKRSRRDRGSTAKERISKMPPCAAGKRSSIYRGVTRHRWTGRYEAHLWDKSTWNQNQNKKGKQVYLGAYDEEEAAARAYDLAALKYWGPGTLINFPVSDYARDVEEMQNVSREDYLASLRRKSSGFSRGLSKFRGVNRHHQNARWDAQMGRSFTSSLPQLGAYGTQLDDGGAPRSTLEYRGVGCITNISLCNFMNWLQPVKLGGASFDAEVPLTKSVEEDRFSEEQQQQQPSPSEDSQGQGWPWQYCEPYQFPSLGLPRGSRAGASSPAALGLLFQSPMFRQMLERASAASASASASASAETTIASFDSTIANLDCNPITAAPHQQSATAMDCNPTLRPSSAEEQLKPEGPFSDCSGNILNKAAFAVTAEDSSFVPQGPVVGGGASFQEQKPSLWNPFESAVSLIPLV